MKYDVIIIGGGIVGTAIARALSVYKLRIALLEKEEELAFGVSKSNSGIIHPGTQNHPRSLKGKLCVQGNILTRKIALDLGVEFKEVGELIVACNNHEVNRLLELKQEAHVLGVPRLEIVDRNWLREHEPNISKDIIAALYAPTAGVLSPYRMVYALAENAVQNGVKSIMGTEVKKISFRKKTHKKLKPKFKIYTSTETFQTTCVINAAGLNADVISRMVGIKNFTIMPRKGEEYILDKKKEYLTNHLIFPLPSKTSKGILIIKTADGNPMIGPTAEEISDKQDLSTSDQGFHACVSAARKMIPSIRAEDIIAYFAGLRPVAGNDFIIRHEDAVPGFVNVAGIQSPGLTAAPAIALLVCDLLKNNGLSLMKKSRFNTYRSKITHLLDIPLSQTDQVIKKDRTYGDIVCRCEMVSAKEIRDAVGRGARTLDGIKFRTRAQAGRCHGGFCTTRIMRILSHEIHRPLLKITKRGSGSEIVKGERT
ncbi:MAG: NAD(P)/FAD-dependent oxidoreductase [bacterium]